jgi:hypothetical protein
MSSGRGARTGVLGVETPGFSSLRNRSGGASDLYGTGSKMRYEESIIQQTQKEEKPGVEMRHE